MNWLKGSVLAVCLAACLPLAAGRAVAETTAPATKSDATKADTPAAKASEDKGGDAKMSETDKRAKATDCSEQADAKKLHGEARKKFRSACKRGK